MLDSTGFDLWADGYDLSVGLSEEADRYPFAGYKRVLNHIYQCVMARPNPVVLDLGFGTGTLTRRLYESGCTIYGMDFSPRMIELAREKMPGAYLYSGDFSKALAPELYKQHYDYIVATYSLHHLTDEGKAALLEQLLDLLRPGGTLLIGDVAFATREELERCRLDSGDEWDDEEIYFVYDECLAHFPGMTFTACASCAGVLTLEKPGLSLYVPKREELWYRQRIMADAETMGYNKGYDLSYDGYHKDTGCIDFPESEWADWYAAWIGREPERFYAYLQREDGTWVGEVNFHRSADFQWHDMGVVIEGRYRGCGYGKNALHLLLHQAFDVCAIDALHNDFEAAREAAYHLHLQAGFQEHRREKGVVELLLTRDNYLSQP